MSVLMRLTPLLLALLPTLATAQLNDAVPTPAPDEDPAAYVDRLMQTIDGDDGRNDPRGAIVGGWIFNDAIGDGSSTRIWDSAEDLDGNLVVAGRVNSTPIIRRYQTANQPTGPIVEVSLPLLDGETFGEVLRVEPDEDGNFYAINSTFKSGANPYRLHVARLSPFGGVAWYSDVLEETSSGSHPFSWDIKLAPDGAPIVVTRNWVGRLNRDFGFLEWRVDFASPGAVGLDVGPNGVVHVVRGVGTTLTTMAIDVIFGDVLWSRDFSRGPEFGDTIFDPGVLTHIDGSVCVFGRGSGPPGVQVIRYGADGAQLAAQYTSRPDGSITEINGVLDSTGDLFLGGIEYDFSTDPLPFMARFGTDAAQVWWNRWPSGGDDSAPAGSARVAMDRFENPYICATIARDLITIKYNPADGGVEWSQRDTGPGGSSVPRSLLVDRGDNVIYTADITGPTFSNTRFARIRKLQQAYASIPQSAMACPRIAVEDRSIWAPGVGRLEESDTFWSQDWDIDETLGGYITIPIPFSDDIEIGGGVGLDTSGEFQFGYKAEVEGGSADIDLPLEVEWFISDELGKPVVYQQPAKVVPTWSADDSSRLTTCFKPDFNAGLTAGLDFHLAVSVALRVGVDLFNEVLFSIGWNWPLDYVPYLNVKDILTLLGIPASGEWFTYEDGLSLFEISMRVPQLYAQAGFNPETGSLSTYATDRFLLTEARISEIIHLIANRLTPFELPPISASVGASGDAWSVSAAYRILYLLVLCDLEARQRITVDVEPRVRYVISTGEVIDRALDEEFTFNMSQRTVCITPYVYANLTFTNDTDVAIIPGIGWETLGVEFSAEGLGYNLLSIDECFACIREDITAVPLDIFDDTWLYTTPEIRLPDIQVSSPGDITPRIVSTSRETLDMIIYDQASPDLFEFNAVANGFTNILLFGQRLTPGAQAFISHHGRTEALPLTAFNGSAVLARIPNRFRLLPGIARMWVQTSNGTSASFDLPIELPRPRLDTVNPNLWAADPDLNTVPVQVIDAGTSFLTDSFIARRDYFITLRDDLWNDLTANGAAAQDYFPTFDWAGMPPFPGVFIRKPGSEWTPLPRFIQPVDSGIHNVRLAESDYDEPGVYEFQLRNPGPGGGDSQIRNLVVAAPMPVVSEIRPAVIDPGVPPLDGGTAYTLIVRGPKHVPHWPDVEEPKYSNFNAASVIQFDGVNLTTTFVSSNELRAEIPFPLIQHRRRADITVFTPDNGSYYNELEWTDVNGNGVIDYTLIDDATGNLLELTGLTEVASGGVSAPMLLEIKYAEPLITMITPSATPAQGAAFNEAAAGVSGYTNFAVMGDNFRPGAVVHIDGVPRDTTFVSRRLLHATLRPEDSAVEGLKAITVVNPGPDDSNEAILTITPPDSMPVPRQAATTSRRNAGKGE